MPVHSRTKISSNVRVSSYEGFQGMDRSRDERSMETNRNQHLLLAENCHCDWRGQIVRDPGALKIAGDFPVRHVAFATNTDPVWVEQTGGGLDITTLDGARVENAFPLGTNPTSLVFARKVYFAARGESVYTYADGGFAQALSPALNITLRPAYMASVQRRMAVAGIPGQDTTVHICRVDNAETWPDDEAPDEESVLRAGKIDIGNLTGTSERITGLRTFENNRLVIFTTDRAIVYKIDPDIDKWEIDNNANINIGCLSHNTIVAAGNDILFCSRSGIHSIRRSTENGILAFSRPLSDKIEDLYLALVAQVDDPEEISAVFDQDRGQYHVYFPKPDNGGTTRLTLTLQPERGSEEEPKFSVSNFLKARCGAFLGGNLVIGTEGGIYSVLKNGDENPEALTPSATIIFPYFWHGDLLGPKDTHSLILQANGSGVIELTCTADDGQVIGSLTAEATADSDDSSFIGVPLSEQYERPFQHRYRAAQYRLDISGGVGLFRIVGFAVLLKK